jgi:alkylated DNA nucleotide flippase Atl1
MTWDDAWEPTPALIDAVLTVVGTIPKGRVMTYGDVADAIGLHVGFGGEAGPYAARMVGRVMQHHGGDVAWWRVIRSTGQPPRFLEARAWPYYVEERTPILGTEDDYRIDLKRARFVPGDEAITQASMFDLT